MLWAVQCKVWSTSVVAVVSSLCFAGLSSFLVFSQWQIHCFGVVLYGCVNCFCWYLPVCLALPVTVKLISTKLDRRMRVSKIITLLQTSGKSSCGKEKETQTCACCCGKAQKALLDSIQLTKQPMPTASQHACGQPQCCLLSLGVSHGTELGWVCMMQGSTEQFIWNVWLPEIRQGCRLVWKKNELNMCYTEFNSKITSLELCPHFVIKWQKSEFLRLKK